MIRHSLSAKAFEDELFARGLSPKRNNPCKNGSNTYRLLQNRSTAAMCCDICAYL